MMNPEYPAPTVQNIASLENLYMAWNRIEKSITYSDVWYDEYEFSRFRFNLGEDIKNIHDALMKGTYTLDKIRPIPFPKGGKNEDGSLKVRQAFTISMKDQLVWVAVCNILGSHIENKMPGWSTGNRLFVPMWKDNDETSPTFDTWLCGSFMNSYPFIYRKWNQGWPRYRKVLTASIKKMAIGRSKSDKDKEILDDVDETEITDNTTLPAWLQIQYLTDGYFKGDKFKHSLYWGSIDLKTFYPTIQTEELAKCLIRCGSVGNEDTKLLISNLLKFEVNTEGFSEQELTDLAISDVNSIGLPTGLIVGRWLANVYLLPVDEEVSKALRTNHNIIHFRYVDDHTFVADNFKTLIDWMHWYYKLLCNHKLEINLGKLQPTLPKPLMDIYTDLVKNGFNQAKFNEDLAKAKEAMNDDIDFNQAFSIDPKYPSPLMTLTLQKVSQISHFNLNLLSKNETEMVFHDLKSLVTVDLPDAEIKKDTRISFASTMLSRLMVDSDLDLDSIRSNRESFLHSCEKEINVIEYKLKILKSKEQATLTDYEKDEIASLEGRQTGIKACWSIAFGDFNVESKDPRRTEFDKLNWAAIDDVKKTLDESEKQSKKRANKVYYLLLKAIAETPDKTNIWIRAMEFCIRHCPNNIPNLYKNLNHVQLHNLGKLFLRRQLNALCSKRVFHTIWRKLQNKTDKKEDEFIDKFMESVIPIDLHYYFLAGTNDLLDFAKAFYSFSQNGEINHIEEFFNRHEKSDINFYLLYLIENGDKRKAPEELISLIDSLSNYAQPTGSYLESLLINILGLKCKSPSHEVEGGHWQDIIHSSNSEMLKQCFQHAVKGGYIYNPAKKQYCFISIRDLLLSPKWAARGFAKSEYFACKLFVDIVNYVDRMIKDNPEIYPSLRLDVANIRVSAETLNGINWHHLMSDSPCFEINYSEQAEPQILKRLYSPPALLDDNIETPIVYELGVIFYHILNGALEDDWENLIREMGFKWKTRINALSNKGRIGSSTKDLLYGCLLPHSWESVRLKGKISKRLEARAIKNFNSLKDAAQNLLQTLRNQVVLRSVNINGDAENPEHENTVNAIEFRIITVE